MVALSYDQVPHAQRLGRQAVALIEAPYRQEFPRMKAEHIPNHPKAPE